MLAKTAYPDTYIVLMVITGLFRISLQHDKIYFVSRLFTAEIYFFYLYLFMSVKYIFLKFGIAESLGMLVLNVMLLSLGNHSKCLTYSAPNIHGPSNLE